MGERGKGRGSSGRRERIEERKWRGGEKWDERERREGRDGEMEGRKEREWRGRERDPVGERGERSGERSEIGNRYCARGRRELRERLGGIEERVERGWIDPIGKRRARREIGWEGRVVEGREKSGKCSEIGWEKDERGERD